MAGGIIGDAYLHTKSIRDLLERKAQVQKAKDQGTSGLKFTKGRELGGQVVITKTLQNEQKVLEGFVEHNKTAVKNRLGAEEMVIRNIHKIADAFKESLVSFCDGTAKDPTSFLVGIKQHLKSIEREGNTKVGDSYILGGTITNVPPFDLSKVADGIDPASGVTLDYYNGNSSTGLIAIDKNDNLECDLVGQHPAFEKLIRALKIASDPSIVSGDVRTKTAQSLTDEALNELADLISQVGSKDAGLDTLIDAQNDRILYLSDAYSKIIEADEAEASNQFMREQRILSTTYGMMARLNEMSLADYLK
ncbi:MAG: flagellin [Alphaproteobacteria bacterium]|nr:flagellin [Alphaproteobacteria bacterium]